MAAKPGSARETRPGRSANVAHDYTQGSALATVMYEQQYDLRGRPPTTIMRAKVLFIVSYTLLTPSAVEAGAGQTAVGQFLEPTHFTGCHSNTERRKMPRERERKRETERERE